MTRFRRLAGAGFAALGPAIGLAWLAGAILRDRPGAWVWLYFIPTPAVVALALAWLAFSRGTRPFMLLLLLAAAGKLLVSDMRWNRPAPDAGDALTLVHWNAAYLRFGKRPALETIAPDAPDLVVLSECRYDEDLELFSRRHLGLDHVFQDQGMALLSRFPFELTGTIPMPNARAWTARIATPSGPLDMVLIDLISHPTLDRSIPARRLADWIAERSNVAPLLVAGDFNTPRDARALDALRTRLRHAYEVRGRGWPYTWPLPAPVYAIDHVWVSPAIEVLSYRLRTAPISDHRRQVTRFRIAPQTTAIRP